MNRDEVALQRWLLLGLVVSTMAAVSTRLFVIFRVDGVTLLETAVLVIFAILSSWIAASFWIGCLGAHALWRGGIPSPLREPNAAQPASNSRDARTVLLVPIYNEDCVQVFARMQAIAESLKAAKALDQFDFFVLSDSTDTACRAAEAATWQRWHAENVDSQAYYRHRDENSGHKSGNIAEFCRNWGRRYDYMVVLDADSLMTGPALVRLAGLMDANPRVALIQTSPVLVGAETLFARTQQFASWVYGRIYAAGLARLQGPDGNYWGHNAIVRVKPFMDHCGLPKLSGPAPFGGEILSHDFVEAALLRRAGWDLWMVTDITGSYEASPPTLVDHLKRDRRWCQGNLQHIKLLFAQGLRTPSRLHMAMGVMGYVSSPLWLLLIVLFSIHAVQFQNTSVSYNGRYPVLAWPISHTVAFISLALTAMAMLYIPKLLALVVLLRDKGLAAAYGGARRLVFGVFFESVYSTLVAPIFMLSHSWFVLNILLGRRSGWGAQRRGGGSGFASALSAFAPHTAIGIVATALAWRWTPGAFWWYVPLLTGLLLAIVMGWFTSSQRWGAAARRAGLFLVPSETIRIPIVDRAEALAAGPSPAEPTVSLQAGREREALQSV